MSKKILIALALLLVISAASFADQETLSPFEISVINPIAFPPVDNVYGLRTSLVYGINKEVRGFDIGLAGECQRLMSGVQINAIGSFNSTTEGIQISGIANIADDLRGLQLSALFNYADQIIPLSVQAALVNMAGESNGGQFGVLNSAQKMGGQFGIYNIAATSGGIQIGLINITSDDLDGYQIGLINISKDRFMPFINLVPYHEPI